MSEPTKLCTACAHHKGAGFCVSPANGISDVDGKPKPMFASERRSHHDNWLFPGQYRCGPEARNFEPLPPSETVFDRLKWRLNSVADWFMDHRCWRIANALDRLALVLSRLGKRVV